MSFQMKMASPDTFEALVKKGKYIEDGLLQRGTIKHYTPSNNDKPKFWSKNKGVVNDGVTDAKHVQNVQASNNTNPNNRGNNQNQNQYRNNNNNQNQNQPNQNNQNN